MAANFPQCPVSLKPIMHYLKVAAEHDERNPVVAYWCRLHALQCGIKLSAGRKNKDETILLSALMDWLEAKKKELAANEAINNDMCAQAAIEEYVLKIFKYADEQDRAENFNKNLVKAFYTSGIVMDVLAVFGDIPDDIQEKQKYAKFKAAYIHNCLKNGEQPIAGPLGGMDNVEDDLNDTNQPGPPAGLPATAGFNLPNLPDVSNPPPTFYDPQPPESSSGGFSPAITPIPAVRTIEPIVTPTGSDGPVLTPDQITKAQKYCKYAGSALNYDDLKTAKLNLRKALQLLETGVDEA